MISFENTKIAFAAKTNKDLQQAYNLFKLVGNPTLVKFGKWSTDIALKLHLPFIGRCNFRAISVDHLPNLTKVGFPTNLNKLYACCKSLFVLAANAIFVFSNEIMGQN